jgi:hypothetical protein
LNGNIWASIVDIQESQTIARYGDSEMRNDAGSKVDKFKLREIVKQSAEQLAACRATQKGKQHDDL